MLHLLSINVGAQSNQQIEIFDIDQGKVIKQVDLHPDIQREAEKILKGITGVYTNYNPIPNKGIMIRIPLEPNVMVRNLWFDDLVDEVTLIFPRQEVPYLLVFDDENKSYFLIFKANTDNLFELLNIKR